MNASEPNGHMRCSYTENEWCWQSNVHQLNEAYASLMLPVVIMMLTFTVVGLLGNSFVLFVYANHPNKTSSRIFIMYLAAIDMFTCVVIHPYIIFKLFHNYDQTWVVACKIFEFTVHALLGISALTLMAIAVDIFLAICYPIKFLRFFSHINKAISATLIVGLCMSIPLLEFYGSRPTHLDMQNNVTFVGYKCDFSLEYHGSMTMLCFSGVIMIGFIIQICCMTVLYGRVAIRAYRTIRVVLPMPPKQAVATSREHGDVNVTTQANISPSTSQKCNPAVWVTSRNKDLGESGAVNTKGLPTKQSTSRDLSTTRDNLRTNHVMPMNKSFSGRLKAAKVLFLVTAVFFLSWLPFFIMRIAGGLGFSLFRGASEFHLVTEHILNHMFYLNNAANPIIYAVINTRFREDCRRVIRKLCRLQ